MEKTKYLVSVSFSVEVEAENAVEAVVAAQWVVDYLARDRVRRFCASVTGKLPSDRERRAIEEAPYADQVTVNEQAAEQIDRRGPVERSVSGFLRRVVNDPKPHIPTSITDPSTTDICDPIAAQRMDAADVASVTAADDIPFF